jgi:hypothetical protein
MSDEQTWAQCAAVSSALAAVPLGPDHGARMTEAARAACAQLGAPWHYVGYAAKATIAALTGYRRDWTTHD